MNSKLKVIGFVCLIAGSFTTGHLTAKKKYKVKSEKSSKLSDKHLSLYLLMDQWVRVKQDGRNLSEYLVKNNFKRIAIYGMNYVGETLLNELQGTDVDVLYAIDKNAENIYSSIPVHKLSDDLDPVDAIIVTPITAFDSIFNELSKEVKCPIVSVEDLLYEIY